MVAALVGVNLLEVVHSGTLLPEASATFVSWIIIGFLVLTSIGLGLIMVALAKRAGRDPANLELHERVMDSASWFDDARLPPGPRQIEAIRSRVEQRREGYRSFRSDPSENQELTELMLLFYTISGLIAGILVALFGSLCTMWFLFPLITALMHLISMPTITPTGLVGLWEIIIRSFIPLSFFCGQFSCSVLVGLPWPG